MSCGGYTKSGSGLFRDAILIPSLSTDTNSMLVTKYSNVCGQSGLGTDTGDVTKQEDTKTLCCK